MNYISVCSKKVKLLANIVNYNKFTSESYFCLLISQSNDFVTCLCVIYYYKNIIMSLIVAYVSICCNREQLTYLYEHLCEMYNEYREPLLKMYKLNHLF